MSSPISRASQAERREKIAGLFAKGVRSTAELSRLVGCSTKTILKDLEALRESWNSQAAASFSRATGQLLNELNLRKREIWAYWMRTLKAADGESAPPTGDPRAFTALKDVMDQEMKLLGLPKPDVVSAEITSNIITVNMIPATLLEQLNKAIDQSLASGEPLPSLALPAPEGYDHAQQGIDLEEAAIDQCELDRQAAEEISGGGNQSTEEGRGKGDGSIEIDSAGSGEAAASGNGIDGDGAGPGASLGDGDEVLREEIREA